MTTAANPTLSPLTLQIGDANSPPYKSIRQVIWADIPPFAVLTGVNGSGKTQLLEVLAYRLSQVTPHGQLTTLNAIPVKTSGEAITPQDMAYLPSAENRLQIDEINIGQINNAKVQFLSRLTPQAAAHDVDAQIQRDRIQRLFKIQIPHQVTPEFAAQLPDDFLYMLPY